MTEQGYPPSQPGGPGRRGRPEGQRRFRADDWDRLAGFDAGDEDEDRPYWAGPVRAESVRSMRRTARPSRGGPAYQGPAYQGPDDPGASDARWGPGIDRVGGRDVRGYPEGPGYPQGLPPRRRPGARDVPVGGPEQGGSPGRLPARGRRDRRADSAVDDIAGHGGGNRADSADDGLSAAEPSAADGGLRKKARGRAAATRRRRLKHRLAIAAGAVVVAAVVVAGTLYLNRKPAVKANFVTTYQKGEFRGVPNACHVLTATAISQYLAGPKTSVIQPISTAMQSQCTYQRDAKPTFRVLNLAVQAYQPYLDVPGDGSATGYARYAFSQQRAALAKPPKHSPEPPATITRLAGLGDAAFSAAQITKGQYANDRATVVVRYRNVVVAVYLQEMVGDGFRSVSASQLGADAESVARQVLSVVRAHPAAGR